MKTKNEKKLQLIGANMAEVAEAWSQAPVGWDTWVSVDLEKQKVFTSYHTTSTSPHQDNDYFVASLPYINEVPDECDDGTGHVCVDDLYDDIREKCENALEGEK